MIPDDVRTEIVSRLRRAEAEHGVRILFAIESGSRARGFASSNSDYDVRALRGSLEKTLVAPFSPDYAKLLERARASIVERLGE